MINKIITILFAVSLWFISLINLSGIGEMYNTSSKTSMVLILLSSLLLLDRMRKNNYIQIKYMLIIVSISSVFILSSGFQGYRYDGMKYLSVFSLVYIISYFKFDNSRLKIISRIYCLLGISLLYIFNYRNLLDGWNPNSIAMVSLFSYLVYMVAYIGTTNLNERIKSIVISLLYIYFMKVTESRGSVFIIVLSILITLNIIPMKKICSSKLGIITILIVPLIVSIFVINISRNKNMDQLNEWSIEKFEKPLFNGRDEIWRDGFDNISKNILFGSGYINSGYWHNSAISCLTSYGVIGYTLWIVAFKAILCKGYEYYDDEFIIGCMTSFLLIVIQQSYELGLFSMSMNLIPYLILGLLLGRINELKGKYCNETATN